MDMTSVNAVLTTADPADWRPGDSWLAGGTVLYSYGTDVTHGRPSRLLDITDAAWPALTWHDDGLEIAATCRIGQLYALPTTLTHRATTMQSPAPESPTTDSPTTEQGPTAEWARHAPGIALIRPCCDAFVASWKIWNVSTVGGNVATALPAGPMISLLAGLDATARILTPQDSARTKPVADLITGPTRTHLQDGELIRSFHVPRAALEQPVAFRRMSLTERGRSSVLLIGRRVDEHILRLTLTASVPRPLVLELDVRTPDAVSALHTAIDAALDRQAGTNGWHDDVHGDPAWRAAMTHRLAEEILAELFPLAPGTAPIHGRHTGDLHMDPIPGEQS